MRVRKDPGKFQEWCMANGYRAEDIAQLVGISKSTVHAYYRKDRHPNRSTMKRMEEALGINPRDFFD